MKSLKIYLFLSLCVFSILSSCKKDLGNYAYHDIDIPIVDTTLLNTSYSLEQYGNLSIDPKITYQSDTNNLSYQWLVYVKSPSSLSSVAPIILSKERNLNKIIELTPGPYYLELQVTDNSNKMVTNIRFELNVQARIESGWLVLHSKNNESDVDFIVTKNMFLNAKDKWLKNLLLESTGKPAKGDGVFVNFSRQNNSAFNWVTVATTEELKRVNGFTFSLIKENEALFRRPVDVISPQARMDYFGNDMLINNGKLHVMQWGAPEDALYSGAFTGDYYLAPFFVYKPNTMYGAIVYDNKNGKFLYTTNQITNLQFAEFKRPQSSNYPFDLTNIGKEMLFMDRGYNGYYFALFKDNTGSGRYLDMINFKDADNGSLGLTSINMSAAANILNAKYFQIGDYGYFMLYATDNTIYRYDFMGTRVGSVIYKTAANETITSMKIFKPDPSDAGTEFSATNNSLLYVATWDGEQGKVYEFSMNIASGIINPVPLNTFTGFGKVKDMNLKYRGQGL